MQTVRLGSLSQIEFRGLEGSFLEAKVKTVAITVRRITIPARAAKWTMPFLSIGKNIQVFLVSHRAPNFVNKTA